MAKHDPLDTQVHEQERADRNRQAKLTRTEEDNDLKWLMSSRRGRRIVWRMLDRAGVFRTSFNTNAMQMAFAEGNRNEGLRLMAQIHELCSTQYLTMVEEQVSDRSNNSNA